MEASTTATLPRLNAEFLKHHPELTPEEAAEGLPERVLQFGTGVFLRGFVDWMIDGMNRKRMFRGGAVAVASMTAGIVWTPNFGAKDCGSCQDCLKR